MPGQAPIRAVFFGDVNSPFGVPHFFELLETPGCEVVGVVTAPPRAGDWPGPMPVPDRWGLACERDLVGTTRERNIPLWQPSKLGDGAAGALLKTQTPDVIVSAGFRSLIPDVVLRSARLAAVNFHPSLLPGMRGRNPWFWTVRRGERETAATVHHMTGQLDAGDLVFQTRIRLDARETASSLLRKTILESLRLVHPLIEGLGNGTLPRRAQDDREATTFREPGDADVRVDWTASTQSIDRLIRACTHHPGALTTYGGVSVRIVSAEMGHDARLAAREEAPGTILKVTPAAVVVKAGDGHIVLRALRYGGQDMPATLLLGVLNGTTPARFD